MLTKEILYGRDKQVIVRAKRLGLMPSLYAIIGCYKQLHECKKLVFNECKDNFALRNMLWNLAYITNDNDFIQRVELLKEIVDKGYRKPSIPNSKMKYDRH